MTALTRSGASRAASTATAAPIEWPTSAAPRKSSDCSTAATSAPNDCIVHLSRSSPDWPWPARSIATTRWEPAKCSICADQYVRSQHHPCTNTRAGAPAPATSYRMITPSALVVERTARGIGGSCRIGAGRLSSPPFDTVSMPPMATDSVLIVGPSWLGDAVMMGALVQRLKARSPAPAVTVLSPPHLGDLMARMPGVDAVIENPFAHGALRLGERWRLGRSLAGRFDQAIVLPHSLKSALIPAFAGVPLRTGFVGEA